MDLRLLAQVLSRHRRIVTIGLVLVGLLTVLSVVRVTSDGLVYRQQEKWQTSSKLLVTQTGFPEGRVRAGDNPDRFVNLAYLYASFMDADPVRALIERDPQTAGERVTANPVVVQGSGAYLPIIAITGVAATANRSAELTAKATSALLDYIARNQEIAGINTKNRVLVQRMQSPTQTSLIQPRPITLPLMVLFAGVALVFGFVFVLDNLKASRGPVREVEAPAAEPVPAPVPTTVAAVTEERSPGRRWQVKTDEVDESESWGSRLSKRQSS